MKAPENRAAAVRIVEAHHTFATADAARIWALDNMRGRFVTKRRRGMVIRIGRRAIEKTTSGSAIYKSASGPAHLAAISVLADLLEEAVLVQSHPDRDNNPNIRQIHRFWAALRFRGQLFRTRLTVKEFVQFVQGVGFYSYELAQIERPAWKQADADSEEQTSAPRAGEIKLTEFLGSASAEH